MLGFNYLVWVGILSWVVVPLTAFFVGRLLWRRSQTDFSRLLALVAGVAILFTPAAISNARKAYYDRQVRALCAKDGGVRVYETVKLAAARLTPSGQPNFDIPIVPHSQLKDSDDFFLEWEIASLKLGNPKLKRRQFRLVRRSDNRLLGESVSYSREGGDLPGPWVGSSFVCPDPTKGKSLEGSVFLRGER